MILPVISSQNFHFSFYLAKKLNFILFVLKNVKIFLLSTNLHILFIFHLSFLRIEVNLTSFHIKQILLEVFYFQILKNFVFQIKSIYEWQHLQVDLLNIYFLLLRDLFFYCFLMQELKKIFYFNKVDSNKVFFSPYLLYLFDIFGFVYFYVYIFHSVY